jgi:hypothetical protein
MQKIIFLDFDGVLNWEGYNRTDECISKYHREWNPTNEITKDIKNRVHEFYTYISQEKIQLLNHITDKTGASIVLSTSWRKSYYYVIKQTYKHLGFTGEIIDKTPYYKVRNSFVSLLSNRGVEIQDWINKNVTDKLDLRYIIIDDNPNNNCGFLISQVPYLVEINPKTGLLQSDVDKAIKILNKYDGVL